MTNNGTVVDRLPATVASPAGGIVPLPTKSGGVAIFDMDGLARFAGMVHKSGLAPKGFTTPEAIGVAIQHGLELGLAPLQSLQSIAVINGRPGIYGDAAMALVRGSGLLEWVKEETKAGKADDDFAAYCITKRAGDPEPRVTSFSIRDAKRAGLWGKPGPWVQYPQRMLLFRARGFNLRDNFPDVLRGIKTVEELQDYPDVPARRLPVAAVPPPPLPTPEPEDQQQPPPEDPEAVAKESRFRQLQEAIQAVNGKSASNELWGQIDQQRGWLGEDVAKALMDQLMAHGLATWAKPAKGKPQPAAALLPDREPGEEG